MIFCRNKTIGKPPCQEECFVNEKDFDSVEFGKLHISRKEILESISETDEINEAPSASNFKRENAVRKKRDLSTSSKVEPIDKDKPTVTDAKPYPFGFVKLREKKKKHGLPVSDVQ